MKKEMINFARHCMMELLSKDDPNDPDGCKTIDALNLIKIDKILNKFETEPLSTEPMEYPQKPEGHLGPLPDDWDGLSKILKNNPPIDTKAVYGPGDDDYGRKKPFWKEKPYNEKQEHSVEMDKCVLCGKETDYPKHMHINFRMYYVEGAGQLCYECYDKTYNENPRA